MKHLDRYEAGIEYDNAFESREWIKKIPSIKFPPEWEVQIIPPFAGALARFRVNNLISVYLDGYDMLAIYGEPYWEVYPHEDGVFRCDMNNIDALLNAIGESIEMINAKEK